MRWIGITLALVSLGCFATVFVWLSIGIRRGIQYFASVVFPGDEL